MTGPLVAALCACVCALGGLSPAAGASPSACPGANLRPTGRNAAGVEAAVICLIDRVRATYGLRPLRSNAPLQRVAAGQVGAMVRTNYFADIGPSGQTPLALVAVTRYPVHAETISVGQNLAWGTGNYTTPAHVVAEWMASPPHREIMLRREFRDAGAAVTPELPGILDAGQGGATYAVEFGVRRR